MMTHIVIFATDMGYSDMVAASLVSVQGMVCCVGIVATGALSDKMARKNVLALAHFIRAMSYVTVVIFLLTGDSPLYHYDLTCAILYNGRAPIAYIPESVSLPFNEEFDMVWAQMKDRGYEVRRLPYPGQVGNSPANCVRYFDKVAKEPTVWLPHYLPQRNSDSPDYEEFEAKRSNFSRSLEEWKANPSSERWAKVQETFELWQERVQEPSENPYFREQASILDSDGFIVRPTAHWISSNAGLHCQMLVKAFQERI